MRVFNPGLISSDNSILLLRHGTDLPVLQSDLNPPLDPDRRHEFEELVSDVVQLCQGKKRIRLFHSSRLRVKQSADILISAIGEKRLVEVIESNCIREVFHGHFNVINHRDGELYPPLVDAWTLWAEALADVDIDYRYGNPVRNGEVRFPSVADVFTEFGENHREFTVRVYSFLVDLLGLHNSDEEVSNIVLAHQAILSRIQRVFNALSLMEDIPPEGELVRKVERSSDRVDIKESRGVVVKCPPKDFSIRVLLQDINHLET